MISEEIRRALIGPGINSETVIYPFVRLLENCSGEEDFWRIFQFGWPLCDNTWAIRTFLTKNMERWSNGIPYLEKEDRDFYDSLPDPIRVYRGCSRQRVRGLAWTTDPAIALDFAQGHRGISVDDAVVATALIPKSAVFLVTTAREEAEVVLNWRRLRQLFAASLEVLASSREG